MCKNLGTELTNNIMYFFFDATNEDARDLCSLNKFYQTILHQLLENIRQTRPKKKAYCFKATRQQIRREGRNENAYIKALQEVLSILAEQIYLVVDALDECREGVNALREWLEKIKEFPNLQIVITSRSTLDTGLLWNDALYIRLQLSNVVSKLDKDIEKFILSRIQQEDSTFPAHIPRVVEKLKEHSSVSIPWVSLSLPLLFSAHDGRFGLLMFAFRA